MVNLLDFLFPKYCVNCKKYGGYLCANCFTRISFDTKNICLVCGKGSYDSLTHPNCLKKYSIDGAFTCIVYSFVAKKLVYRFKYKPYVRNLGSFLGDFMYESLIQNEEYMNVIKKDVVFVPIPLSEHKLRRRGFNQAEVLAKDLSKRFGYSIFDCLVRKRDTKTQVGLTKIERKENVKGAFELNNKFSANFKNPRVILVDDVLTTGSTFSEIASVLKHYGAREVWAVALAKES